MFCSYCGKKISDDSRFCPYCGASVSVDDNVKSDNASDTSVEETTRAWGSSADSQTNAYNVGTQQAGNRSYENEASDKGSIAKLVAVIAVLALFVGVMIHNSYTDPTSVNYASDKFKVENPNEQGNSCMNLQPCTFSVTGQDDKIYFTIDDHIYEWNTSDDTKRLITVAQNARNINVVGQYLYYSSYNSVYKVNLADLSNEIVISDIFFSSLFVCHDHIICETVTKISSDTSEYQLCCFDLDGSNCQVIDDESCSVVGEYNDCLYYKADNSYYKYSFSDNTSQYCYDISEIAEVSFTAYIINDKLFECATDRDGDNIYTIYVRDVDTGNVISTNQGTTKTHIESPFIASNGEIEICERTKDSIALTYLPDDFSGTSFQSIFKDGNMDYIEYCNGKVFYEDEDFDHCYCVNDDGSGFQEIDFSGVEE